MIFYAVPETNPLAPPTCFVPRWWDYNDGYLRSGVGTDNKWRVYEGEIPVVPVKRYEGRKAWWTHGMSYATYLAGGYHNSGSCIVVPPLVILPVLEGRGILSASVSHGWASSPSLVGRGILTAAISPEGTSFPSLVGRGMLMVAVSHSWVSSPSLEGQGMLDPDGLPAEPAICLGKGEVREGEEIALVQLLGQGVVREAE